MHSGALDSQNRNQDPFQYCFPKMFYKGIFKTVSSGAELNSKPTDLPVSRVTNSLQFAWRFPSFRTQVPSSQKPSQVLCRLKWLVTPTKRNLFTYKLCIPYVHFYNWGVYIQFPWFASASHYFSLSFPLWPEAHAYEGKTVLYSRTEKGRSPGHMGIKTLLLASLTPVLSASKHKGWE